MKKSNYLIIISFMILLILSIYSIYCYKKDVDGIMSSLEKTKEECKNSINTSEDYINYCNELLNEEYHPNFFSYLTFIIFKMNSYAIILILFIVTPSLYYLTSFFKNGIIKNNSTRESYKKTLSKLILNTHKSAIILPIITLILFIVGYILTKDFNVINYEEIIWNKSTVSNPLLFMTLYLLNIIIHSLIFCNIALCIARKKHNFVSSIILTFITYIGIEILLEVGISNLLLNTVFKVNLSPLISILNMMPFNDSNGIVFPLVTPFLVLLISYIVIYFMYRDKEKLIIDCN